MKLTPLDIHHKEFRHSLRGYSEEEVDAFLDEVADEFERLFKENIDLSEKLEAAAERVRGYQSMETTLNNTLVAAQRSSEDIIAKAGIEADTMLRDAELKSKEIIHNALQKKQTVANELVRIKQAEEDFRNRYKALLDGQLRAISEITLPDDVSVLLGDTEDGVVGEVEVRPAAAPEPSATVRMPSEHEASPGQTETLEVPLIEPPASGFVESVTLGEVGEAELPAGPVELIEPGDFELPGFDTLGERESDIDIEEID
jgi:cell division initiation protein